MHNAIATLKDTAADFRFGIQRRSIQGIVRRYERWHAVSVSLRKPAAARHARVSYRVRFSSDQLAMVHLSRASTPVVELALGKLPSKLPDGKRHLSRRRWRVAKTLNGGSYLDGMRGCRPLTPLEIKLVLRHLSGRYTDRNRALFTLALKSGLRIGSLLALRIEDVWDGAVLPRFYVRRTTVKGKTSGFSSPLHPTAAAALDRYIRKHCSGLPPTTALFFSSKRYKGLRALDRTAAHKLLKKAYAGAALKGKLACHSIRKTFAERVYLALGHDLLATQRAMQHSSISSTILYLAVDQERVDKAILRV